MKALKIGELVQLKSGGPAMTVVKVSEDGEGVNTKWFAGAKADTGYFPVDALQPFTPPSAPAKK